MTFIRQWPHWSQQLDVARSAPLACMGVMAKGQRLAIAGQFAPELAIQLNVNADVIAVSPSSGRSAGAIHPEALANVLDANDALIVADIGLAQWLIANPTTLLDINLKLQSGIFLPARLSNAACSMVWGDGFSWVEHTEENAWIWCEAPTHATGQALLHNLTDAPLLAQVEYELGCISEERRNVTLALDDVEFDIAPIGEWRSRPLCFEHGVHKLTWTSDIHPIHRPESSRALSFCVKNFRLMDSAGDPILSVWQAYEVAREPNDPLQQDIPVRRALHKAGFVSITGVLGSGGVLSRQHSLELTHGSPSHSGPFAAASGELYAGTPVRPNEIAWFLASRRTGADFEGWARSICDAR